MLGVASRCPEDRLTVTFVSVVAPELAVTVHAAWRGRVGTAPKQQLADLITTAQTRLEQAGARAVAVKRAESPASRPTVQYDHRTRLEGAVMVAAPADVMYRSYRMQELKGRLGDTPLEAAGGCCGVELDEVEGEALAAACAALRDLGYGRGLGDS